MNEIKTAAAFGRVLDSGALDKNATWVSHDKKYTDPVTIVHGASESDILAGLDLLKKSRDGGPYCDHTESSLGHGSACYDKSLWKDSPND